MKRLGRITAVSALLITVGGAWATIARVNAQGGGQVPQFQVDPLWPQPFALEKHMTLGSVTGVSVDALDHIWVSQRGLPSLQGNEKGPTAATWAGECCYSAPLVIEYDQAGKMLNNWGGTSALYQWPQNPGGVTVDGKGYVWIPAQGLPAAAAGGRGRGGPPAAAPAAAAGAPTVATPPAGDAAAAGRGGRGARGAAPGGAAPAGGAPAAGGAAPPAGGGRGGRGGGAPGGAAPAAAGGAAPAAGAPAAAQAGRGAPPAGAPPAAAAPAAAAAAPPPADAHILKFSKTGQFIAQFGTPGNVGTPDSTTTFNGPTSVAVDDAANEVYVADSGNRRIIVIDATTGAYKRHWFGSGEKTSSPAPGPYAENAAAPKGFRDVSCVRLSKDGMVYVCDSASNRIQVFRKDGTFVKEGVVKAGTGGFVLAPAGGAQGATYSFGSAWDAALSSDTAQRFLYVADGMNKTVWVLDRNSLQVLSRVGDGGRYPGLFYALGSVAVDARGNLYTGEESDGKRVQKFTNKGMGAPRPLN